MYTLRVRAWRDPAKRLTEICDTLYQVIEAYRQIGIDQQRLVLAAQSLETRLHKYAENVKR
jgi:hypothetical protein